MGGCGVSETTEQPLGKADLLALIADLCADARKHTDNRAFGYAANTLENARRAAETYAVLVHADTEAAA